jgi:hypothetical protein
VQVVEVASLQLPNRGEEPHLERFIQRVKDRTECFDDSFPCRKGAIDTTYGTGSTYSCSTSTSTWTYIESCPSSSKRAPKLTEPIFTAKGEERGRKDGTILVLALLMIANFG